jgi:23S rRNA-/tRNA-specific pseudouridylate synthase
LGDALYGDALYGDAASAPRLMLHAAMLKLLHPVTRAHLHFVDAPPF